MRWRLLSGNHRDLGRSVVDHPDVSSCRRDIEEMLAYLRVAEFGLVRAEGHRWSWRLTERGTAVASSGHSFDRRTRCEQGYALFVLLAPVAAIREELSVWPARGRPALGPAPSAIPARVGTSWPAVHSRSADRSLRPGYLTGRALRPDDLTEPKEASR